jgi:hypothetical protein
MNIYYQFGLRENGDAFSKVFLADDYSKKNFTETISVDRSLETIYYISGNIMISFSYNEYGYEMLLKYGLEKIYKYAHNSIFHKVQPTKFKSINLMEVLKSIAPNYNCAMWITKNSLNFLVSKISIDTFLEFKINWSIDLDKQFMSNMKDGLNRLPLIIQRIEKLSYSKESNLLSFLKYSPHISSLYINNSKNMAKNELVFFDNLIGINQLNPNRIKTDYDIDKIIPKVKVTRATTIIEGGIKFNFTKTHDYRTGAIGSNYEIQLFDTEIPYSNLLMDYFEKIEKSNEIRWAIEKLVLTNM